MNSIELSIIIPYYQQKESIQNCLTAIADSDYKNFEVIIVDDASFETLILTGNTSFPLKISVNSQNRGGGYSRNQGAKIAQGGILVFIDADISIERDTLSKIIKTFESHPAAAAVFGAYDNYTPHNNYVSMFKNLFHHFNHQQAQPQAATFWTGCGAIKKNIFLSIGMFSEQKRITPIEDIELGYRLYKQGYPILINKNITVTHLKKYTLGQSLYSDIILRAVPWTYIILQEKIIKNDLNTSFSYMLSVTAAYTVLGLCPFLFFYRTVTVFSLSVLILILLYLNRKFLRLAWKTYGTLFAFSAVILSFIHFINCGIGFIGGFVLFYKDRLGHSDTNTA